MRGQWPALIPVIGLALVQSRSKYFLSMNFLYYVDCESYILFPNFPNSRPAFALCDAHQFRATFYMSETKLYQFNHGWGHFRWIQGPRKTQTWTYHILLWIIWTFYSVSVLSLLDINYYTFHMTASNNSLFLFVSYIVNRVDFPSGLYTTQMFETKYISGLRIFKGLTPCIPLDCQSTEEHVCLYDFPLD